MHKQGDQVVYVESGLESNALVISSVSQPDVNPGQEPEAETAIVEHLGLLTIPHHTQGISNLTPLTNGFFARTVFGVRPFADGHATGWKEGTAQSDPAAIAAVKSGYGRALTGTQSPVLLAQIDGEPGAPATHHVVQQTQPYYEGRPSGMHAVTFVDSTRPTVVYEPEGTKPQTPEESVGTLAVKPAFDPAPEFADGEVVTVELGNGNVKHGHVLHDTKPDDVPAGTIHVVFDDGESLWVSPDMVHLPTK